MTCERPLPEDVRFVAGVRAWISPTVLPTGYFGTVFMSNYLEHLRASEAVIEQLRDRPRPACAGRSRHRPPAEHPAGRPTLLGLHRSPSRPDRAKPRSRPASSPASGHRLMTRFLPYSTKGRLPRRQRLVRAYLRLPPDLAAHGPAVAVRRGHEMTRLCAAGAVDRHARLQGGRGGRARPARLDRRRRRPTRSSSSTTSTRTRPCRSSSAWRPSCRRCAASATTSVAACSTR